MVQSDCTICQSSHNAQLLGRLRPQHCPRRRKLCCPLGREPLGSQVNTFTLTQVGWSAGTTLSVCLSVSMYVVYWSCCVKLVQQEFTETALLHSRIRARTQAYPGRPKCTLSV